MHITPFQPGATESTTVHTRREKTLASTLLQPKSALTSEYHKIETEAEIGSNTTLVNIWIRT